MRHFGVVVVAFGLLGVVGVQGASAQIPHVEPWTERGFLNVSFGAQPKARSVTVIDAFELYGETATIESVVGTNNGGVFDVAAGYRLWQNLAIGAGVSRYSDSTSTTAVGTIPHPLFTDSLSESSLDVDGLQHAETAVHISAVYMLPFTEKIQLAIFAGPSFFSMKKDLPTSSIVTEGGTTLESIDTASVSQSGVGGHFGIDVRYMVTPRIGGGLFVRYAGASVDLDQAPDGKLDVGGAQYGLGVRIAF